jgi:hydrogenase maturation factor
MMIAEDSDQANAIGDERTSACALSPDPNMHCITCGDIALAVRVLSIDSETGLGLVALEDDVEQVDLSLVDGIAPGDLILVHGGVALERLEESTDDQPGTF